MKLLVGLGNPGQKFVQHRHNVGFIALDQIAEDHQILPWKEKMSGLMAVGKIASRRVTLLKPQTYMNDSGRSVGAIMRYFKINPTDVVVFHDELDLAPGRMKTKSGGGSAGHNGLRSIQANIGDQFSRIRIGIGHPGQKNLVHHYVLHNFSTRDEDWLGDLLPAMSKSAAHLVDGNLQAFTNEVARRRIPIKKPQMTIQRHNSEQNRPDKENLLSRLVAKFNRR